MVTQDEHQPKTIWEGLRAGSIRKSGSSHGYDGLEFRDTPAQVLEVHLSRGLIERKPLLFLPLFDSQDPQLVLTAIYIYRPAICYIYRRSLRGNLKDEDEARIVNAFRKLLERRDARIRFAAIETLGKNRLLNVNDVQHGLNDRALCVRFVTASWLDGLIETPRYNNEGKLVVNQQEIEKLLNMKRELAPILLEHLNDTHYSVRSNVSSEFRGMFKKRVRTESGRICSVLAPTLPKKLDWIRSDWQTREETKQQWKTWWTEHGEEALQFAHPPQD